MLKFLNGIGRWCVAYSMLEGANELGIWDRGALVGLLVRGWLGGRAGWWGWAKEWRCWGREWDGGMGVEKGVGWGMGGRGGAGKGWAGG